MLSLLYAVFVAFQGGKHSVVRVAVLFLIGYGILAAVFGNSCELHPKS